VKSISLLDLKLILHQRIAEYGGIRPAARALGIDAGHLCQAMKPGTKPIPSIAAAIGYREAETRYERA
jgi:hypothetical protein